VEPNSAPGDKPLLLGAALGPLSAHPTLLLCLVVLFVGSGCAALIYEIVWFQMLQLVIGSTAVSLGVLLASFMGGMCLGSILLPRCLDPAAHPLRAWAFLELCVGALGLAVFFALPWLSKVYVAAVPSGFAGIVFRGTLGAVCLLPPTLLMGATLPAIGRLAETTHTGASQLGLLYGANTLGAVLGALIAGFYLLRVGTMFSATCAAASINGVIGLIGFSLRMPVDDMTAATSCHPRPTQLDVEHWRIYVTIGLSGLCALGAEIVWTRLLSLMLGGTTYTLSIILAVFLLGLGIGSGAGAVLARWLAAPRVALGTCQLLLMAAIAWAAIMLSRWLPYWPVNPALARSISLVFQLDLVRCVWAILPAACLWGASFPLALAATVGPEQDSSRLVGRLYAANTIGAIVGAVGTSIWLIAWLGTQQTQRLLVVLSALAGFLALGRSFADGPVGNAPAGQAGGKKFVSRRVAFGTTIAGLAALLAWSVPGVPWPLLAYGRWLPTTTQPGMLLYQGEGMNASVAVTELASGVRTFHISGKVEASTDGQDMRLQRMLAHIPALFHPDPRSVLVVGCGAGITAGSFLTHPGIERIRVCEIEPLIPRVVAGFFGEENYDLVRDPRVRFICDDARHYLLTTREKFDIITSDPIHPWVKGAASLYTQEYFQICKRHLNPGGMVTQWVPLYESSRAAVRSEIATFFEVFPEGTIWSNDKEGAGYDLVLLGQAEPLEVEVETLQQRLSRADHNPVAQSLRDVGIRSAFGLTANYAGCARDLKLWLKPAEVNHDGDLRLQYLAGLGLNLNESGSIYDEIMSFRKFPEDIFPGANLWNDALRRVFLPAQPRAEKQGKDVNATGNQPKDPGGPSANRYKSGAALK
jgi:spermidine synthase